MSLLWSEKREDITHLGTPTVITLTSHTTEQLFQKHRKQSTTSARHEEHYLETTRLSFVREHLTILAFCMIHFGKCKPQGISSSPNILNEIESLNEIGPCWQVVTFGLMREPHERTCPTFTHLEFQVPPPTELRYPP